VNSSFESQPQHEQHRQKLRAAKRRGMVNRRVVMGLTFVAAMAGLWWYEPADAMRYERPAAESVPSEPSVVSAREAFGTSGHVRMQFVRAGEALTFPLEVRGSGLGYTYQWMRVGTNESGDVARPLTETQLLAPLTAGIYELQLTRGAEVQRLAEPKVAVLVPFERKLGGLLNGYRIGQYPAEWSAGRDRFQRPPGFVEVHEADAELKLSTHLQVSDFLTHDAQKQWPRYVAIDPRVVDKIELVLQELARRRGDDKIVFDVRVHSGFRTPLHNAGVEGSARDSRHMYGDAADVAIDADGDGRFTIFDAYQVERAVDWIEGTTPFLAGGMGVYSSPRWPTPYVHIDARGERKRWRG
jgi:uncharacterized protein YcbK (DUF882 family)